MKVDEFDYHLPEHLIAQTPLADRSASRLMIVDPVAQSIKHKHFGELTSYLKPGDVLVFNNSKVLPARLFAVKSDTGARIELLLTKPVGEAEWQVMAKPAKRLREGVELRFVKPGLESSSSSEHYAVVTKVLEEGLRQVRFHVEGDFEQFLDQYGVMPLPPYIRTPLETKNRYQTVYADVAGSVAAPTAGLHFTEPMLDELQRMGVECVFVTLHVGLGTFRPVQVENVAEHVMHYETYQVSREAEERINRAKAEGRRIIAVGTTALRTLESATEESGVLRAGSGETGIFIYPGYRFKMIDALVTNFHLPKSTLLMLVSALIGTEFMKEAYETAVQQEYRFFSFGDAMFITRRREL